MQVEKMLKYASAVGRLKGTIIGVLKYSKDEISPSVYKSLEKALRFAEDELGDESEDLTFPK